MAAGATTDEPLAVYVHFPYCRRLCPYCDFPVAVAREPDIPHDEYLAAVLHELGERAGDFAGRRLVSIYFGGGTPSLWRSDCLAAAIDAITEVFAADRRDLEITIEANPSDCTDDLMADWRQSGIDRLSIGVQSMEPGELRALGRDHRMGDGAEAVKNALAAGFPKISADVIFGIPGSLTAATPGATRIAELGPGHLSVYELTIEERTAFGAAARRGALVPLGDDVLAELYTAAHRTLTALGYEHYEISSYARPGQRSLHNQQYWRGSEYLGLGNGAASFRRLAGGGGERITNCRSVKQYMRRHERVAQKEVLDATELSVDLLWLAMRTADGVASTDLDRFPRVRDWLLKERLADQGQGRIRPTLKGFLYCDRIASRLVEAGATL